ncbi:MAG: hypothetical protein AAF433_17455 [Bacteroidota bacterium]
MEIGEIIFLGLAIAIIAIHYLWVRVIISTIKWMAILLTILIIIATILLSQLGYSFDPSSIIEGIDEAVANPTN